MDRLKAMQVFVEVADRGSLSAAAVHLDMSRAMVSRYLAEMEQWVGVRLLHRTTRRLSLTPAGAETLPRCRQMLDMVGDLRSAVSTPDDTPKGLLRITTSMSFGSRHLAGIVADYVKLHPGTSVDLMLVERAVNLVEERVDLAVRITNDLDPNLIARKLAVCRSVVCASPDYLEREGEPARIEDLSLRNCLTHSYFGKSLWRFERDGEPVDVPVDGNISANEVSVLLRAALEGRGSRCCRPTTQPNTLRPASCGSFCPRPGRRNWASTASMCRAGRCRWCCGPCWISWWNDWGRRLGTSRPALEGQVYGGIICPPERLARRGGTRFRITICGRANVR